MSEVKLSAQPRSEFGKGAARRLRQANQVPAVLYGHGTDPVHVTLPGHDTMLALKQSNVLLSIDVAGKATLALAKDVQRNAIKGWIEHVDLLIVRRGEKVTVDVPLTVVGEAAPGTLVTSELNSLSVEVEATHIPTGFEVNVDGLEAGAHVTAGQITLPEGATLIVDEDAVVVVIAEPRSTVADDEAVAAEAAAASEASAAAAAATEES